LRATSRLLPLASRLVKPAKPAKLAGFTLIELVITVAIIGILALGLIPLTQLASQRAKEQELRAALREIRTGIDAYKKATDENRVEKAADQTGYPPKLDVLAEGVKDIKTPDGKMIYFLRRIPRDPFFDDDQVPAGKTWGLRSYASPPDEPKEGEDVFDVYSLSKRKGLNGIAYKDW
jgi:general secretion pathway protein G